MLSKLKALGPGLLYAGAAVGVSHVVQSTKAGAEYGYILILGIVLAHVFKYPFFELGPKYTQETQQNLLHGFKRIGKWALAIVALLTIGTMFTIQAAVTIVTSGLALKITGLAMSPVAMSAILLIICIAISAIGRFNVLDKIMKVIMITLSVTTVIALVSSFFYQIPSAELKPGKVFDLGNGADIIFLIAFLGWMPAPLDISIWHSIWSEEEVSHGKQQRKSMFDFRVGFWGTAILGASFLMLGANVIYGSGIELAAGGVAYAQQLIDIYVKSIGSWSYWIIAIAAFTTMFSTTLTCLDAMPRVLTRITALWRSQVTGDTLDASEVSQSGTKEAVYRMRVIWLFVIAVGALVLLQFFISDMKQMVNVATSLSFLTAPILAILMIQIVRKQLPKSFWPAWKYSIAFTGVAFLILLGVAYLRLVAFS